LNLKLVPTVAFAT